MGPWALAVSVGALAPMAFLGCGIAGGAVAICFAKGGSRIPTSGGVYGYIEAAFGPVAGYCLACNSSKRFCWAGVRMSRTARRKLSRF